MKQNPTKKMNMVRMTTTALTLLLALAVGGCGDEDNPTNPGAGGNGGGSDFIIPDSWEGTWDLTVVSGGCDTQGLKNGKTITLTLCGGESFVDFEAGQQYNFVCNGTVDDENLHAECSSSFEISDGCTVTSVSIADETRNGDTITGVQVVTSTYTSGCEMEDTCIRETYTAVRRSEPPNCAAAQAASSSWGTGKSIYR